MDQKELLAVIEKAAREGATELDLSSKKLTALPPEVGKLTSLTFLDLSQNQLTALPIEVCHLRRLTKLSLSGNDLTYLPAEIGQLYLSRK